MPNVLKIRNPNLHIFTYKKLLTNYQQLIFIFVTIELYTFLLEGEKLKEYYRWP